MFFSEGKFGLDGKVMVMEHGTRMLGYGVLRKKIREWNHLRKFQSLQEKILCMWFDRRC